MSTIIMSKCWPLQMPPTQKSVLISLADNANDHGVCWPSIPTIAMRTCFSERAVQGAIKWLEKHGALRADRSNGRHTTYVVTPDLFAGDASGSFHYIYKITHQPTGQFYIGMRSSAVPPEKDDYFGSGKYCDWLEEERQQCVKQVLGTFDSRQEAARAESMAIQMAISDEKCLNRKVSNPENGGGTPAANAPRSKFTPNELHPAGGAPTPAADAPLPPQEIPKPPQEVPSNRKEPSKEPSMNRQSASKATRLAADWALPKKYGEWALHEFPLWDAEFVRKVATMFRNHWVAKSGKDAAKLDWFATWQNWCLKESPDPYGKGKTACEVPSEWWTSSAGIEAKGRELGLVPTEQEKKIFAYYRDRVFAAAGSGPWNDKSRS